jgi:COP9 signalosome complex subunit 1
VALQTEPVSEAKLKAAAGMAHLDGRRYKAAARAFVSVSPDLGTNYSDVSAPARVHATLMNFDVSTGL